METRNRRISKMKGSILDLQRSPSLNLNAAKSKLNVKLKDIFIVLHDIRSSHLIPVHQRYLFTKQKAQSTKSNDLPEKNENKSENGNSLEVKAESNKRKIASDEEKKKSADDYTFGSCTRSTKCQVRRSMIQTNISQTSNDSDENVHPCKLLKINKISEHCDNNSLSNVVKRVGSDGSHTTDSTNVDQSAKTISMSNKTYSSNNSMVSLKKGIDGKCTKSTCGKFGKYHKVRNCHTSDNSNPTTHSETNESISITSKRRSMRILSSSSSNESNGSIQIVQADTTVYTSNEEKAMLPLDVSSGNCNHMRIKYDFTKVLNNEEIESTSQDLPTAATDNDKIKVLADAKLIPASNKLRTNDDVKKKVLPKIIHELVVCDRNISIASPKNTGVLLTTQKIETADKPVCEVYNLTNRITEKNVSKNIGKGLSCTMMIDPTACIEKRTDTKADKSKIQDVLRNGTNLLTDRNCSNHLTRRKIKVNDTASVVNDNALPEEMKEIADDARKIKSSPPVGISGRDIAKNTDSQFSKQPSRDDGMFTSNDTNCEPPRTREVAIGSLTTENLQKHVENTSNGTILRKYIQQTSGQTIFHPSADRSSIFLTRDSKDKSISHNSKRIKLIEKNSVQQYDSLKISNDHGNQDGQAHKLNEPIGLHETNKSANEQIEIKKTRSCSFPNLKRPWQNVDGKIQKIRRSEERDVASGNVRAECARKRVESRDNDFVSRDKSVESHDEDVGKRDKDTEIPTKRHAPEYIVLREEKSATSFAETKGGNGEGVKSIKEESGKQNFVAQKNDSDDCISLFADSLCFSDDDLDDTACSKKDIPKSQVKSIWSNDVQCNIVNSNNFDAYVKKNLFDFDKDLEHLNQAKNDLRLILNSRMRHSTEEKNNYVKSLVQPSCTVGTDGKTTKLPESTFIPPLLPTPSLQYRIRSVRDINMAENISEFLLPTLFKGYCFMYLAGKCCQRADSCRYEHVIPPCVKDVYVKNQCNFRKMLNYAIARKWRYLAVQMYVNSLPAMTGQNILETFDALHKAEYLDPHVVTKSVQELNNKKIPVYFTIRQLMFMDLNDATVWEHILQLAEKNIPDGQFWRTVKPLVHLMKSNKHFVETVLRECLESGKGHNHAEEVHRVLISCLSTHELLAINEELILKFYYLLGRVKTQEIVVKCVDANMKKIVDENVEKKMKERVEENVGEDLQEKLTENVGEDVQGKLSENVDKDVQEVKKNVDEDVEGKIEQNTEENVGEDVEGKVEQNVEENVGEDVKGKIEQNEEQNVVGVTEGKAEENMEENVDENVNEKMEKSAEESVTSSSSTSEDSTTDSEGSDNSSTSSSGSTQGTERSSQTSSSAKSGHDKCNEPSTDDRNNANNREDEGYQQPFRLQPIDDLPSPQFISRGTFSKFYEDVNNLRTGLKDRNYDYVIDILNRAAGSDKISFYTDCCYQILRAEVIHSQEHLKNLIERTVQRRMYHVLYDILENVALRIIIDLAEEGAWVFAYRLLKILQKYILRFDAAFVLLSAEIYLANRLPLEALILLKQHNLIFTNRSKWNVDNNADNEYHRAEVIHLLLEALCRESLEHASILFQFLCTDQSHKFQPIDLSRHTDRIMSMLLLTGNDELIVTMGRFIIDYNFTLRALTFRATIVTIMHKDPILARQMYQYAVRLGIYNAAQFSNIVTLTINATWTEEEMYLAILELLDQLSKDIGPAIEHLKFANLKVYLNIERVPTEKQLYSDVSKKESGSSVNKDSRILLQRILARRFDPLLKLANTGKYCRMVTRNVTEYLRTQHCT